MRNAVGGADAAELRSLDSHEWILARVDGGRGWDRTSDPYDVNVRERNFQDIPVFSNDTRGPQKAASYARFQIFECAPYFPRLLSVASGMLPEADFGGQ
jgi:hypothetical protein